MKGPEEGNLCYLYEGPRAQKASPGHWDGICSTFLKGPESKKLLQATEREFVLPIYSTYMKGPESKKLLQASRREFVLPI